MIRIVFAVVFLVFGFESGSVAQNASQGLVVSACGTTGRTYTAGTFGVFTIDINGNLCFNGSGGGSIIAEPYLFTPLTPEQHNLGITVSTSLTIPAGALFASICARGNNVNYTFDGTTTPTSSVGNPLAQGQCIFLSGATVLANFRAIQAAATATLDVAYTK